MGASQSLPATQPVTAANQTIGGAGWIRPPAPRDEPPPSPMPSPPSNAEPPRPEFAGRGGDVVLPEALVGPARPRTPPVGGYMNDSEPPEYTPVFQLSGIWSASRRLDPATRDFFPFISRRAALLTQSSSDRHACPQ